MKRVLMLGSSWSACFSQIDTFSNLQLSIAANSSTGLFGNLEIDANGVISCNDIKNEWNNIVFNKSLGASSRCIHDYDSIILNIRLRCDLPAIFNFKIAQARSIHLYSFELIRRVIESTLMQDHVGLEGNRHLIEKLRSSGYQKSIFLMTNPFTASFNYDLVHDEDKCASRKQFLLDFISSNLGKELGVKILLPSICMINSHLFIHSKYVDGKEANWRDKAELMTRKDPFHKNKQYAIDMLKANADKLGL